MASLLFSQDSGITNNEARNLIENNTDDLGSPGWDQYFGSGRINAFKALQSGDNIAPAIPTGLVAQPGTVGNTQVELTWNANTEFDLAGYNLYRSENDQDYAKINVSIIATTSYFDTDVAPDTTYYYKLSALDSNSNGSDQTSSQSTTPADVPPNVPSGLSVATGNQNIDITWNPNTETDLAGYNLYRSENDIDYIKINASTIITMSYLDNTVVNGIAYYYKLSAEDSGGLESTLTNSVFATPDGQSPTDPTNLMATAISSSQIDLSWVASTDNIGVAGYEIERGTDGINFTEIDTISNIAYQDTGLNSATTYYYRVRACDAAENKSSYSNTTSDITTTITRYEETDPNVSWTGNWYSYSDPQASSGSRRFSSDYSTPATCTFSFTGNSVTWIGTEAYNRGVAKVYIDDVAITDCDTALSGDSGTDKSGIDLYDSGVLRQQTLYTNNTLGAGSHTIKIEVTNTNNPSSSSYYIDVDVLEVVD